MTTDTDRAAQLNSLLANLAAILIEVPNPPAAVLATQPRLLLTVDEAAEQLSIGRTTAWALVRSGDLESVQIGRLRRVHVDAVAAYAAQLSAKQRVA
jgi:excisionase family DNA binding protein